MAMTSKERVLAAIMRRQTDRVPCAPFFNFQIPMQRVGKRWQYPFGPSELEAIDFSIRTLGIDQVASFSINYEFSEGVTQQIKQIGDVLEKTIHTPSGSISAQIRFNRHWPHGYDIPLMSDFNSAHFVKPWITQKKELEAVRHLIRPPTSKQSHQMLKRNFEQTKQLADEYQVAIVCYFGLGLTGALNVFGAQSLCTYMVDDPDLINEYLAIDHECNMQVYRLALDLGVDMLRRNGFYETCDFYSPTMLKEFLQERLKAETNLAKQAGKPIGYTVLSGFVPMLDHLRACGFDCLVCPDVFLRDGDAQKTVDKLGDCMSFWTGPSDTIHMPWENEDVIKQAVSFVFEAFGKTGLLITPCSSSKAVYPWKNVLAMIDQTHTLNGSSHK